MHTIEIDKSFPFFEDVLWVSRAVSKDPGRPMLAGVYVEKGWLIATDGHRLHARYFEEDDRPAWEDGNYKVLTNKKSEFVAIKDDSIGKFPDWKEVFNRNGDKPAVCGVGIEGRPDCLSLPFAKVIRMLPENESLCYKYFCDLKEDYYDVKYYGEGPVYFESSTRWAAIMTQKGK